MMRIRTNNRSSSTSDDDDDDDGSNNIGNIGTTENDKSNIGPSISTSTPRHANNNNAFRYNNHTMEDHENETVRMGTTNTTNMILGNNNNNVAILRQQPSSISNDGSWMLRREIWTILLYTFLSQSLHLCLFGTMIMLLLPVEVQDDSSSRKVGMLLALLLRYLVKGLWNAKDAVLLWIFATTDNKDKSTVIPHLPTRLAEWYKMGRQRTTTSTPLILMTVYVAVSVMVHAVLLLVLAVIPSLLLLLWQSDCGSSNGDDLNNNCIMKEDATAEFKTATILHQLLLQQFSVVDDDTDQQQQSFVWYLMRRIATRWIPECLVSVIGTVIILVLPVLLQVNHIPLRPTIFSSKTSSSTATATTAAMSVVIVSLLAVAVATSSTRSSEMSSSSRGLLISTGTQYYYRHAAAWLITAIHPSNKEFLSKIRDNDNIPGWKEAAYWQAPNPQAMIFDLFVGVLVVPVLSGWIAGRWIMRQYFPDDDHNN